MSDLIQLFVNRLIDCGMLMAVDVAPQAADSIDIDIAVDVSQGTAQSTMDDEWFIAGHLRKGMPNVVTIPILEGTAAGSVMIFGRVIHPPVHFVDPVINQATSIRRHSRSSPWLRQRPLSLLEPSARPLQNNGCGCLG